MKFKFTKTQSQAIELLHKKNYRCFIVGGAIRDKLLGREPSNIDFVKLRQDTSIDDIRKDLARRDFTINAMAVEILPENKIGQILDPFGGQADLASHTIRFVIDPNISIQEDYSRILRACRFSALGEDWKLGVEITSVCRKYAHKINLIPKEHIRDELVKGLLYPKPSNMFRAMLDMGLLPFVFPDLEKGVGCTQNQYHEEPVFDHLLRCLDASVSLTDNPMLRLAALTHDIAKPHTKKIIDGSTTFYKHEVIGSNIVYNWMKDLKFSKNDCNYVSRMVRSHQWHFEENSHNKTIRHWLKTVGPQWRDLILLRMADRLGNLGKQGRPAITKEMQDLINKVEKMIAEGLPLFEEDLAIDGRDLVSLGIKPGPIFGNIFSDILGKVAEDPNRNSKEWILDHVKKVYIRSKEEASHY